MATHSSILSWRIPRSEAPRRAMVRGVAQSRTRAHCTYVLVYLLLAVYSVFNWSYSGKVPFQVDFVINRLSDFLFKIFFLFFYYFWPKMMNLGPLQ